VESPHQLLYELFNWENRERRYLITFVDGKQWELTDVVAGQDRGDPSHAIAEIVREFQPINELPRGRAVFFYLTQITAVTDPETGTVLFEAGRTPGDTMKMVCPCCRYLTLDMRGGFEICPVCWWEDDGQSDNDADQVRGGPNGNLSLSQARTNYRQYGAISPEFVNLVRIPTPEECGR
jgi:hypothetical protein